MTGRLHGGGGGDDGMAVKSDCDGCLEPPQTPHMYWFSRGWLGLCLGVELLCGVCVWVRACVWCLCLGEEGTRRPF